MDYIDTKDVAAELRNRLKSAFPGVKFSVRKGTGTASAWISVYWTDGPCTADVEEHTRPMQGAQFNGMEDRYESTDNTVTVTVKGRKVTGKPLVDGINTHRDVSDDALKAAAVLWSEAHDGTDPPNSGMLAACVVDGHVIQENWAPQQMWQIASDVVLPQRWAAAKEQAAAQAARPANAREQGDEGAEGLALQHTDEDGTTVTGTRLGDGAADVLKRHGFKWHRKNQYWYAPGSRDQQADTGFMDAVAADLHAENLTVTTAQPEPTPTA
ncbi:LPD29 domain-containing protein [Streptomyces sp. NBC_01455]|uniref:LPD29 domain-containing protein n=1 Tax=Streptomyces sp. NBC_01455 TaxID=2903874 RepID=UPI002E331EAC|nr:LPD29 domain-containing protein [Streptomyces sp. NBC_01455]